MRRPWPIRTDTPLRASPLVPWYQRDQAELSAKHIFIPYLPDHLTTCLKQRIEANITDIGLKELTLLWHRCLRPEKASRVDDLKASLGPDRLHFTPKAMSIPSYLQNVPRSKVLSGDLPFQCLFLERYRMPDKGSLRSWVRSKGQEGTPKMNKGKIVCVHKTVKDGPRVSTFRFDSTRECFQIRKGSPDVRKGTSDP